jgi:hypothetical protein
VDGRDDPDLANEDDVGVQTSVRLKPTWVVRVAEDGPMPQPPPGHAFAPLAQLRRPRGQDRIEASMIGDLRQRRLTVSDMERRLSLMERTLLLPAFVGQPAPQFVPKSGVINQTVTLHGTNFDVGPVEVRFGEVTARLVGTPSATQIVTRVPPGLTPAGTPATVKITVRNPGGSAVSDDSFTVRPAPAFADPGGQFSPASGAAGTRVTINGFNFNVGGLQVLLRAEDTSEEDFPVVEAPSPTRIVAEVPDGLVPPALPSRGFRVRVVTNAGDAISNDTFLVERGLPAPAFTSPQFIPRSGVGGQTITLNGRNFDSPPVSVRFADTGATVVGSPSETQIAVQVPTGMTSSGVARQVNITVTTGGGSITSSDTFTVNG